MVRLWLLLALLAAFLVVSYAGLWEMLPRPLHITVLVGFVIAALASVISLLRIPGITREEAIRRIERVSGVPHRPASSYEDTLTASANDPATRAIWEAHKSRMARMIGALKAVSPTPRTDTRDPFAMRAAALLAVGTATALLGSTASTASSRPSIFRAAAPWRKLASTPGSRLPPTPAARL